MNKLNKEMKNKVQILANQRDGASLYIEDAEDLLLEMQTENEALKAMVNELREQFTLSEQYRDYGILNKTPQQCLKEHGKQLFVDAINKLQLRPEMQNDFCTGYRTCLDDLSMYASRLEQGE